MALDIAIPEKKGLDLREKGKAADGAELASDRRLYMQMLAFSGCQHTHRIVETLEDSVIHGVLYEELNDPTGVGLLTFSEDANYFVDVVRPLVHRHPFSDLTFKPEFTLFGRTYTIGYETDLDEVLVERPIRHATHPDWPWAVWYPLRRSGRFEQLPREEQRAMLMEHGGIGMAYGRADHAHDIRLACHGFDVNDNDFIAGLMGKELYPLSMVVQHMRRTRQTSEFLEKLGPFFVGKAVWRRAT
ncbi:MAG: chlorite dismutase family protein [Rhodothermales bacterium]|nr:chlorite dismutase family protein [Rhodothermales bacterium]